VANGIPGLVVSADFTFVQQSTPDETYRWQIDRSRTVRLVSSSPTDEIVLAGVSNDPSNVKLVRDTPDSSVVLDTVTTGEDGTDGWQFTLPAEHMGAHKWFLRSGTTTNPQAFVVVIPPDEQGITLPEPVVTNVDSNKYGAYYNRTVADPVGMYGGYVRMAGRGLRSDARLQFAFFIKNAAKHAVYTELADPLKPVIPRDGLWEAETVLNASPPPDSVDGLVHVFISGGNDSHRYSEKPISFQYKRRGQGDVQVGSKIDAANLEGVALKPSPTDNDILLSGLHEFTLSGTVDVVNSGQVNQAEVVKDARVLIYHGDSLLKNVGARITLDANQVLRWTSPVEIDKDGIYSFQPRLILGQQEVPGLSSKLTVHVNTTGPQIVTTNPLNREFTKIRVTFNVPIGPQSIDAANLAKFRLVESNDNDHNPTTLSLDGSAKELTLTFASIPAEVYTLVLEKGAVTDVFAHPLAGPYQSEKLFRPIGGTTVETTPGIPGVMGLYVEFPEYTKPRKYPDGFNPADRVETRVSRLYYYRDAHRVAQIINRNARSYNRAAVQMHQQIVDHSRMIANQATNDRRAKERNAVKAAQDTRQAEAELQQAEATAASAAREAANAAGEVQRLDFSLRNLPAESDQQDEIASQSDHQRQVVAKLEDVARVGREKAAAARLQVQQRREREGQLNEHWQAAIAVEDDAREEQFCREVAAARADPDTYAAGDPNSDDPVRQVSVSVIGEGLIQLRGPIKGINVIRTMINQIDAPVGQARVSVHTVQINGEKGDRMERVAGRIQRFIDHSRFLTMQSAEMLRKSIVYVAARRAMQCGDGSGLTQHDRDEKYLHAFFGEDFIRELESIDSEFLKTGNKLLSLHSMDSTSLASALFLMVLANNATRVEIVQHFEGMMSSELPMAEQNYFEAGLTCDGKHSLFDGDCCRCRDEFQFLSENARFQSIRGFFDADLGANETMTPVQREFVRLAQIFKSRLVVEMELRQRVMERAVIEERLGDYAAELKTARIMEQKATEKLRVTQATIQVAQRDALLITHQIESITSDAQNRAASARRSAQGINARWHASMRRLISSGVKNVLGDVQRERWTVEKQNQYVEEVVDYLWKPLAPGETIAKRINEKADALRAQEGVKGDYDEVWGTADYQLESDEKLRVDWYATDDEVKLGLSETGKKKNHHPVPFQNNKRALADILAQYQDARKQAIDIVSELVRFKFHEHEQAKLEDIKKYLVGLPDDGQNIDLFDELQTIGHRMAQCERFAEDASVRMTRVLVPTQRLITQVGNLGDLNNVDPIFDGYLQIERGLQRNINEQFLAEYQGELSRAKASFQGLLQAKLDIAFARQEAERARRPLDHKKLLDMLVDEMEDKYIELLEGTRAHTANVDAYIQRLITALDDDFNTQFYYPTFRHVRTASQLWDVQTGQVETTTVLANNRAFAKVTPQATMEFDLPKRDIVINEAINGAKAVIDDIGALAQDPTFLALAKLGSGQPTSSQAAGASGGLSSVRDVLPGLSTDTAEEILGQHGPGGAEFGAAMEALIPDPAIYKFETGTGWEIRPVIQPDGQALVFNFNYLYTTNIREPVRADEKHLGRVKRHFVNTDVQLSNFELREVSRYSVALKASRTSRGVPLLEDIPIVGALFRPLPSDESSLQQNIILCQATIFPTLFDLMGLRWAPVVADLDPLRLSNDGFIVRNRIRMLMNRVFDHSSSEVDEFLRIPAAERRMDLYRSQETVPNMSG